MRRLLFLLILLLPVFCFGQDVTRERVIARSTYYNGIRIDSAKLEYNDKAASNDYFAFFYQFASQLSKINFSKRTSFSIENVPRSFQYVEKNESLNSITLSFLGEYNDEFRKETVSYVAADTNLVSKHIIWMLGLNNRSGQAPKYFEQYNTYNNNMRITKDSINWWDDQSNEIVQSSQSHYKYYSFEDVKVKTNVESQLFYPGRTKYHIDSSGPNFRYTENYINDKDTISGHTARYVEHKNHLTTLLVELNCQNSKWDTTNYEEYQYTDSLNSMDNLVLRLIYKKDAPTEAFSLSERIEREYQFKKELTSHKSFKTDSAGVLQLSQSFEYEYDQHQNIIKIEVNDIERKSYSLSEYTYTKMGNMASENSITIIDTLAPRKSEYYYYYEPYLTEETDLNYNSLVPITYPNPFSDNVNILFSVVPNKAGIITITNLQGEVVHRHHFNSPSEIYQYSWNALSQPAGIYIARIVMDKEIATLKLIKQ